jgi:hypothetical protein
VYLIFVVTGNIQKVDRLEIADIGLLLLVGLLVSAIWLPGFFSRLQHFKVGPVEFRMLENIQESSKKHEAELEDMRFVLTQLMFPTETHHLENLNKGETKEYIGGGPVRSELRRLRTLGLIEMLPGRHIGELKDGKKMDVSQLVKLTEKGKDFLRKLGEMQRA